VNEIRSGVISYAAAPERQRRVPKLQSRGARKADINRFRLHMKSVLGHADSVGAEIFVALRGAKSADDVNLGVRAANGPGSIRYNIENPWIVVMHFSSAVIPQEMVELRESLGNVGIAVAIHDIQMLSCMSVKEPQTAFLNRWGGTGYGNQGENR
jgi:hypothetical protein